MAVVDEGEVSGAKFEHRMHFQTTTLVSLKHVTHMSASSQLHRLAGAFADSSGKTQGCLFKIDSSYPSQPSGDRCAVASTNTLSRSDEDEEEIEEEQVELVHTATGPNFRRGPHQSESSSNSQCKQAKDRPVLEFKSKLSFAHSSKLSRSLFASFHDDSAYASNLKGDVTEKKIDTLLDLAGVEHQLQDIPDFKKYCLRKQTDRLAEEGATHQVQASPAASNRKKPSS